MKVVKNACYGGFGLSPLAIKEIAKLQGKECYFFIYSFGSGEYKPLTIDEAEKSFMFFTYSVPNPQDYNLREKDEDGTYKTANKRADEIKIDDHDLDRHNPDLIKVVEELGEKANGKCARLVVVEIPDDVKYEIDDYDGYETIREIHRSW